MAGEYNRATRSEARPEARLEARLLAGPPLVLDGATGTELERRGVACQLPLWSAHALLHAPETVRAIHADYARAGAEILTANTFRTQERTLARAALSGRGQELTQLAVSLAREGANDPRVPRDRRGRQDILVAGSLATLEDCYRPDRVPEDDALEREHGAQADTLAAAGADLILVETMNTLREARSAAHAARATGLPFFISFVCGVEARLLSGEELSQALDAVAAESPACVLVNCLPPSAVPACLPILGRSPSPFGVYPNLAQPSPSGRSEDCSPEQFAAHAAAWCRAGARIIGGCCGTGPDHVRALAHVAGVAAVAAPND